MCIIALRPKVVMTMLVDLAFKLKSSKLFKVVIASIRVFLLMLVYFHSSDVIDNSKLVTDECRKKVNTNGNPELLKDFFLPKNFFRFVHTNSGYKVLSIPRT